MSKIKKWSAVEIKEIYKGCLYSIKLGDIDEYNNALKLWQDLDYLINFFEKNAKYIDQPFWLNEGLSSDKPIISAERVATESLTLANYIRNIAHNTISGNLPDFDNFFKPLGGKYSYIHQLEPYKSYGTFTPSLLRLYAIKIATNVYIVVFGGIKLGSTIQNSPDLGEKVFNRIDNTIAYLKANGILDAADI